MILIDKEAKTSVAKKEMQKKEFLQTMRDVKNGEELTPL